MDAVVEWINAGSTLAIAIAAIFSACLTYYLFRENRLLRKAGTEPEVIAYLTLDRRSNGAINFVLSNIGQGPARNVRFVFHAQDDDFDRQGIYFGNKADRRAINILPQGESIESFFGLVRKLLPEPRLKPFDVSVEYENIYGKESRTIYRLDVSQFSGFATLGRNPDVEIASSLKNIETVLRNASTGLRRIKVESLSSDQRHECQDKSIDGRSRPRQTGKSRFDSDELNE